MRKVDVTLHRDFSIGTTDPRLFGAFVEHLGRCVYGGLYEPGHPTADERGFRGDVLALVRGLGAPIARSPRRPNPLGRNELGDWWWAAGLEPMLAVNLGTRDGDAARNLVEYCNHPGGTYWSDLRKSHGWPQPHNVKLRCV